MGELISSCKSISSKVNVIVWLGFEPAYYDVTVQHISHYTPYTSLLEVK